MQFVRRSLAALVLLASTLHAFAVEPMSTPPTAKPLLPSEQARVVAGYGKLPLSFEPNQGQADPQVKFLSRGDGYNLALTSSEAILSLRGMHCSQLPKKTALARPDTKPHACTESPNSVLRMTMLGGNLDAQVHGSEELPGKSNYFMGSDSSTWHTNIANYQKVQYRDVYPGIDLVYYGNQRQLEHDFIVTPGADPRAIHFRLSGAQHVSLTDDGNLNISTPNGKVELHRPVIYQESAGVKIAIHGSYRLQKDKEVGFRIANYDHSLPLIIDPVLVYSTYFGGFATGGALSGIAIDTQGNAYVAGSTSSTDFPLVDPLFSSGPIRDIPSGFVSKLNATGTALLFSTYFGPHSTANPSAIAVDTQGNAYITGEARHGLPLVNHFQVDPEGAGGGFVSKISADGSQLLYSTYLGGYSTRGEGIAVDSEGAAYIVGISGLSFPAVHALFPIASNGTGFLAKVAPTGHSLVYSTYMPGTYGVNSVAVDALGEAIVFGGTKSAGDSSYHISPDFPLVNNLFNVSNCGTPVLFAAKFAADGAKLIYSTPLPIIGGGGTANAAGEAFATGAFGCGPFPGGLYPSSPSSNGAVLRLNSSGSSVLYATYLGIASRSTGTGGNAIAVDTANNAYIVGYSQGDLPIVNAIQPTKHAFADAFITKVNPAGTAFVYSTYLGGRGFDTAGAIAVDPDGNAYIMGQTDSPDFPLMNPLRSKLTQVRAGFEDGFITKISSPAGEFSITNTVDQATIGPGGDLHYTITVTNSSPDTTPGVVSITSLRDRFHTCAVSNGDPCTFVPLGGRATVQLSPLANGESRTIAIYATAAITAGDYNLITNTATVSTGSPLEVTGSASVTTTVRQTADIAITSSLVDSTNGALHYVHTITNLGPDNAHAVLLLDPLPADTTYVSATTTAGQCSFHPTIGTQGAVRCPLNNPNAGSAVTVNVVLQAIREACPSVTNTATITSQSIDADGANDAATVTTALPTSFCTLPPPPVLSYSLQVFTDLRTQAALLNNAGDLLDTYEHSYLFKHGPYNPISLPFIGSFALNDRAQVVGQASIDQKQAIQIYDNGNLQSLDFGPRPSNVAVVPVAINNSGTIAGYETWTYTDAQHPKYQQSFIYKDGTTEKIFPTGVFSRALNQKDEVVGEGNGGGLLYSHGMIVSSFPPNAATTFYVAGLDSSGRVGGFYGTKSAKGDRGYIYSGGHFRDLGDGLGPYSIVLGMNDCGELVGKEDISNKGFIYTHGRFVGLDALVEAPAGYFLQPLQINNSGLIFGQLFDPSVGSGGTFLLTPTTLEKCGSDATINNAPDSATIAAGGNITYKIKVKNLDTAAAQFTVADELDATTTFVSCGVSGGGGTCMGSPESHLVSAALKNLIEGSAATVTVVVKAASSYPSGSVVMNTATLSSTLTSDYLSTAYTSVP